jgi:hypothetical protein
VDDSAPEVEVRTEDRSSPAEVGLIMATMPDPEHGCHADVFGRTDGRTDDRTDDWTKAARASVTWTHYSVLFEVTWGKTRRIPADALASAQTRPCVRTDARVRPRGRTSLPSPSFPCYPRVHGDATKKTKKKKLINLKN